MGYKLRYRYLVSYSNDFVDDDVVRNKINDDDNLFYCFFCFKLWVFGVYN